MTMKRPPLGNSVKAEIKMRVQRTYPWPTAIAT